MMRMATFSTATPLSYPSECSLPASPRPVCLQYPLPFHSLPGHIHDTRFVDPRSQTLLTRNIHSLPSSHISTKLPKHQISVYRTRAYPSHHRFFQHSEYHNKVTATIQSTPLQHHGARYHLPPTFSTRRPRASLLILYQTAQHPLHNG